MQTNRRGLTNVTNALFPFSTRWPHIARRLARICVRDEVRSSFEHNGGFKAEDDACCRSDSEESLNLGKQKQKIGRFTASARSRIAIQVKSHHVWGNKGKGNLAKVRQLSRHFRQT